MGCDGGKRMATFSIVIPCWSGTPELEGMAIDLANKVRPMCDELIICEDGGYDSKTLRGIADHYLWHRWNLGDIRNLTLGIWMASGDFVGILNSDITIHKGSLRDLCLPGQVGCPTRLFKPGGGDFVDFCFVVDMELLRKTGYPHSGLAVGPDWNWSLALEKETVIVPSVEVSHTGGVSYSGRHRKSYEDYLMRERTGHVKEIDPMRHKQRMTDDEEYRKVWGVSQS